MVLHIKDLLKKSLREAGIKNQVDTALVLDKASAVLEEIVGKNVAKKVQPMFVRNKSMNLACLSSVVAQEVKLHERQIIKKINSHFDRDLVERLSFTT